MAESRGAQQVGLAGTCLPVALLSPFTLEDGVGRGPWEREDTVRAEAPPGRVASASSLEGLPDRGCIFPT